MQFQPFMKESTGIMALEAFWRAEALSSANVITAWQWGEAEALAPAQQSEAGDQSMQLMTKRGSDSEK